MPRGAWSGERHLCARCRKRSPARARAGPEVLPEVRTRWYGDTRAGHKFV